MAANMRGDRATFWRMAEPVYRLVLVGAPISANCMQGPMIRARQKMIKNSQPLFCPSPCRMARYAAMKRLGT